jgi:hypothetical protein
MSSKKRVRKFVKQPRKAGGSNIGLLEELPELAELPDLSLASLDPDHPPLWVIAGEGAAGEKFDLPGWSISADTARDLCENWKSAVLKARKEVVKHHVQCLERLFRHYNIEVKPGEWNQPNNPWYQLVMALAGELLPAFQMRRALQERSNRRADKPCKLDAWGSSCLFVTDYLKDVSKKRPLTASEERCLTDWTAEMKQRNPAKSTMRALRTQMLAAPAAYWAGNANAFQRQFVEQVEPRIHEFLTKLAADHAERRCKPGSS